MSTFINQSFVEEEKRNRKTERCMVVRSRFIPNEESDGGRDNPPMFRYGMNSDALPPLETEETSETLEDDRRPELQLGNVAGKDGAQKSIEDTLGLLKEQMVEDKRNRMERSKDEDSRKLLKRSKVLAKQLISRTSANAIGFASQLWVSAGLVSVKFMSSFPF
jgi:hypothetical protein